MVKLFCAIVDTRVFEVKSDECQSVGDLKVAIAAAMRYEGQPDLLQLFLWKTEDGWLPYDDDLGKMLLQNRIDTSKLQALSPNENPQLFGPNVSLGEDVVHVLVKVKDLPAPFPSWDLAPNQFPPLVLDQDSTLMSIPAAYAENSGLHVKENELMLYLRKGVKEEWDALLACVVKTYALLWIVGPPGAGKSLAAFAFACQLKRVNGDLGGEWGVLWISCSKGYNALLSCIFFRGKGMKLTCTIRARDLDAFLETIPDNTIIFLDGFAIEPVWFSQPDSAQIALVSSCSTWRYRNKLCRRLVIVTSMVSLGKHWKLETFDRIPSTNVRDEERFRMYSWTLPEYQEALKHDKMFTQVMKMFGVNNCVPIKKRQELVEIKYYVAGGSARMMFDFSTSQAETALADALLSAHDILKYLEGPIGLEAPLTINRLLAWYPNPVRSASLRCLVSSYVAKQISLNVGPERLQTLAYTLSYNPAMDGQMLEMGFVPCLRYGGVQCHKFENGFVRKAEKWPKSEVNDFDPESNDAIELVLPRMWFEPQKWDLGGFDAVFVDLQDVSDTDTIARQAGYKLKLHVRFVQVARSETYSYKAELFTKFLLRLRTSMEKSLWISDVEVCFVVPKQNVKAFSIPVDERDFRTDVVVPVIRLKGVPGTMSSFYEVSSDVSIRVQKVGIRYDLLETTGG